MLFPSRKGPPPDTSRTGLPQVWASMQENVRFIFVSFSCELLEISY